MKKKVLELCKSFGVELVENSVGMGWDVTLYTEENSGKCFEASECGCLVVRQYNNPKGKAGFWRTVYDELSMGVYGSE